MCLYLRVDTQVHPYFLEVGYRFAGGLDLHLKHAAPPKVGADPCVRPKEQTRVFALNQQIKHIINEIYVLHFQYI